jgi:hypothetical protein
MFKCIDKETSSELISIDDESEERKSYLRQKSENDALICPICKIKVFPRLGEQRLWHFAHVKSEIDCPLKSEDPNLFQARAILYKWLRSKFGSAVSIEKEMPDYELPRPIDCWVEGPKGRQFAYWLLNKQLKYEERLQLKKLQNSCVDLHLIVLDKFLRIQSRDRLEIKLFPTERELMIESEYSRIYQTCREEKFSVPFLNISEEKFIIYRNLHWFEGGGIYRGFPIEDIVDNFLISPKNGEFVMDGEFDTLAGKLKKDR